MVSGARAFLGRSPLLCRCSLLGWGALLGSRRLLRRGTLLGSSLLLGPCSFLLGGRTVAGHKPDELGAAHVLARARVDLDSVALFDKQWHLHLQPSFHLGGLGRVVGSVALESFRSFGH